MVDRIQQDKPLDKLGFSELAVLAMQMASCPMTPSQLWDFVVANRLHYRLNTFDEVTQTFTGKTPNVTFCRNIYTDKENFQEVPNTKPKQYILKNANLSDDEFNVQNPMAKKATVVKNLPKKANFHERKLHCLLAYFLKHDEYFKAYAKTIFHEESQKTTKGADKWLYPDMVAVNFEYASYQKNNVLEFIEKFDLKPIKIFSFEIKKELNFSNYKEYFFQAVSNSSWANEGYLVATTIQKDNQFKEALQKLSQSFGIGIIELNVGNISQSSIVSPAKFKEKMDYAVIDDLANKNPKFAQFLKTVSDFDSTNESRFLGEFDTVLSSDELGDYLQTMILQTMI